MPKSNPLLNPPDEIILSISTYRYQKPGKKTNKNKQNKHTNVNEKLKP